MSARNAAERHASRETRLTCLAESEWAALLLDAVSTAQLCRRLCARAPIEITFGVVVAPSARRYRLAQPRSRLDRKRARASTHACGVAKRRVVQRQAGVPVRVAATRRSRLVTAVSHSMGADHLRVVIHAHKVIDAAEWIAALLTTAAHVAQRAIARHADDVALELVRAVALLRKPPRAHRVGYFVASLVGQRRQRRNRKHAMLAGRTQGRARAVCTLLVLVDKAVGVSLPSVAADSDRKRRPRHKRQVVSGGIKVIPSLAARADRVQRVRGERRAREQRKRKRRHCCRRSSFLDDGGRLVQRRSAERVRRVVPSRDQATSAACAADTRLDALRAQLFATRRTPRTVPSGRRPRPQAAHGRTASTTSQHSAVCGVPRRRAAFPAPHQRGTESGQSEAQTAHHARHSTAHSLGCSTRRSHARPRGAGEERWRAGDDRQSSLSVLL